MVILLFVVKILECRVIKESGIGNRVIIKIPLAMPRVAYMLLSAVGAGEGGIKYSDIYIYISPSKQRQAVRHCFLPVTVCALAGAAQRITDLGSVKASSEQTKTDPGSVKRWRPPGATQEPSGAHPGAASGGADRRHL